MKHIHYAITRWWRYHQGKASMPQNKHSRHRNTLSDSSNAERDKIDKQATKDNSQDQQSQGGDNNSATQQQE